MGPSRPWDVGRWKAAVVMDLVEVKKPDDFARRPPMAMRPRTRKFEVKQLDEMKKEC